MESKEFEELMTQHFDGTLSQEDGLLFAGILRRDRQKAIEFARAAALHNQVRSVFRYEGQSREPARPLLTWSRPSSWLGISVLAASIVAVLTFLAISVATNSSNKLAKESLRTGAPAAYLMSANGCNWGRSGPAIWNVGQSVEAGDEVALNEGVAEFRLAGGAYLGAEGPASLLLASPTTLVLQYGKLTSHVPWGSNELKVVAAGCRILAREAEFGLCYSNNKLDIHVFSGQVTANSLVAPVSSQGASTVEGDWAIVDGENCFTDAVITAGKVLQLTTNGEVLKVAGWDKAKPSSFIGKLSMSGPLNVTQEYIDEVLKAKPVSYWRFEQIVDEKVPNEISAGPALKARNKPSLDGSRENLSADFYPNGKFYLISEDRLPLANSDYSIEAWVKPSHLHLGSIVTLTSKENDHISGIRVELQGARNDSFQRRHAGVARFHHYRDYHRDANNRPVNTGSSCYSSAEYSMRRWQHLVAVKHGSDMQIYMNGKLQGSGTNADMLPRDVRLHVGVESDYRSRHFVGQIDELAIYNRALTKQEVSKHFKLLKEAMSIPGSSRTRTPAVVRPTDT